MLSRHCHNTLFYSLSQWPKDFQSKVDTLYSINDDTFLFTPISICCKLPLRSIVPHDVEDVVSSF